MDPSARCTSLDSNTFVLGLNLGTNVDKQQSLPTRFHFVLDNSGSMGRLTSDARNCFSELISTATAPCSLVTFTGSSKEIGRNFTTPGAMRSAVLPGQGQTNITAGVSTALEIIEDIELSLGSGMTHHVLILLSDGQHNKGPAPEQEAPQLGHKLRFVSPQVQLSVIVVGVSKNSNTNMGMVMKTNLETIALSSLLPIYFAQTPSEMMTVLTAMKAGLETIDGTSVQIEPMFAAAKPISLKKSSLDALGNKSKNEEFEEVKGTENNSSVWNTMSTKIQSWMGNEQPGASQEPINTIFQGILESVGEPLKSSSNIWINGNEEVPLICVGYSKPIGLLVTFKDGKKWEVPIAGTDYQMIMKKDLDKKSAKMKVAQQVKEWTCVVCTYINEAKDSTCNVCGTIKQQQFSPVPPETAMLNYEEEGQDDLSMSIQGAMLAGQALAKEELSGEEQEELFDEGLATQALEALLEKARISKIAHGGNKSNKRGNHIVSSSSPAFLKSNGSILEGLKWLIGSFEKQMELKAESMKKQGGGMKFGRANGHDRVRQHKLTSQTLTGLKELKNQFASIEAFDSKDSSSQAEFLNGAKSKYAAKALSRNAKRYGEGEIDPMTAMLEECANMEEKMKLALRQDMCRRLALATQALHEAEGAARADQEMKNKQRFVDIFIKSGGGKCNEFRTRAKQLMGQVILEPGLTVASINKLLELHQTESDVVAQLVQIIDQSTMVDDSVDEYLATLNATLGRAQTIHDIGSGNKERSSYLSLLTQREQLGEWAESASECGSICTGGAYEALMFLGTLAYPIEVQRRAATQLDPYAMSITRVRTSVIDTASLCCALKSNHTLVPPEGGVALSDALVLIDCDCPQASKLAVKSKLVGEIYTSVVISRDLNMYTGSSQRIALHAHAFACLSAPKDVSKAYKEKKKDFEAMLKRTYLGKAYQCRECSFGPVDHMACSDLSTHDGESVGNAKIDNSCPRCHWFSSHISDWPMWNGVIPKETYESKVGKKPTSSQIKKALEASAVGGFVEPPSRSSVEVMLRVLYSARILMGTNTCKELVSKLSNWEESITTADGVDHPFQLALALACICDDEMVDSALALPPLLMLLNEMCSRTARDSLKMQLSATNSPATAVAAAAGGGGGTDGTGAANEGGEENLMGLSRTFVSKLLGITEDSAPEAKSLEESEPSATAVREICCGDYTLQTTKDLDYELEINGMEYNEQGDNCAVQVREGRFDFESFVEKSTEQLSSMVLFALALRKCILKRGGGWTRLAEDMETGSLMYADVVSELADKDTSLLSFRPASLLDSLLTLENNASTSTSLNNLECLERQLIKVSNLVEGVGENAIKGKKRITATMTAQAFLHYNSAKRRTCDRGGSLTEELGDVRDGQTLRNLAIDLRMIIYQARVAAKMRQWKSVGSDIVVAKARAADIGQYIDLFNGRVHAHGLDKPTFWGLWEAARRDSSCEKVEFFLSQANAPFAFKHGHRRFKGFQ